MQGFAIDESIPVQVTQRCCLQSNMTIVHIPRLSWAQQPHWKWQHLFLLQSSRRGEGVVLGHNGARTKMATGYGAQLAINQPPPQYMSSLIVQLFIQLAINQLFMKCSQRYHNQLPTSDIYIPSRRKVRRANRQMDSMESRR